MFQKQNAVSDIGKIGRALQLVQKPQIAADQPSFRRSGSNLPIALVFDELTVFLIPVPRIVRPLGGRMQLERLVLKQAFLKIFDRIVDSLQHAESGKMRSRIGDQTGLGINCVCQRGNIGKTTQDFRIFGNQPIVDPGQNFNRVKSADHGQNAVDRPVGKSLMQILQPRRGRRRTKFVGFFRMPAERNAQSHFRQTLAGDPPAFPADDSQTARRCNHPDMRAFFQFCRYHLSFLSFCKFNKVPRFSSSIRPPLAANSAVIAGAARTSPKIIASE